MVLVSTVFIVWDYFANRAYLWHFSEKYTIGLKLFGLPLEEILFFIVAPVASMILWHTVARNHKMIAWPAERIQIIFLTVAGLLLMTFFFVPDLGYTRVVLQASAVTLVVASFSRQLIRRVAFWRFQIVGLGLLLISDIILTGIPIITYNSSAIIGWRAGSVPIENLLYNFSLLTLFLIVYTSKLHKNVKQVTQDAVS